jgi:hypothetical protein
MLYPFVGCIAPPLFFSASNLLFCYHNEPQSVMTFCVLSFLLMWSISLAWVLSLQLESDTHIWRIVFTRATGGKKYRQIFCICIRWRSSYREEGAGDVVHSDMYDSKHMEMGTVAMHFSVTLSKDCYFIHEAWESIGLHHILPLLRMCSSSIKLLLLCSQWAITAAFMDVHAGQNLMWRKELVEWVEKKTPQFQTRYFGFKGVFPGDTIVPISQTRVCYKTSYHPALNIISNYRIC